MIVEILPLARPRIEAHPFIGTVVEVVNSEPIRKARLRRTEQNVYYSVDEAKGVISIHTVWGARRGPRPER